MVDDIRARMPKLGGRKLYHELKADFIRQGFKIGRDGFFQVLRQHDRLVKCKKRYYLTTDSKHRFQIYDNQVANLEIKRVHQVLVSDITYLRCGKGFVYLALVSDLFSRKIIGYDVSESLGIASSLRALRMALKAVRKTDKVIHHSDRGIQYCSHDYVKLLTKNKVEISMAAKGNPYENPVAERINGILKHEFLLNQHFTSLTIVKRSVNEAIMIYNQERPHASLAYMKPAEKYKIGLKAA